MRSQEAIAVFKTIVHICGSISWCKSPYIKIKHQKYGMNCGLKPVLVVLETSITGLIVLGIIISANQNES
jgi:hypothetical protein